MMKFLFRYLVLFVWSMISFDITCRGADIPSVLFLSDRYDMELADEIENKIASDLQVLGLYPQADVKYFHVSGVAEAVKVYSSYRSFRVLAVACDDYASNMDLCRKIENMAKHRTEVLWFDGDNGPIRDAGYYYADFSKFLLDRKTKSEKREISYVADAIAQWWTGVAESNQGIRRIPLWDKDIPLFEYDGPEYINSVGRIDRISKPELEIFLPEQADKSPVVIFIPGGGLSFTGFVRNARELAEILIPQGIAVVGVKYRVKKGEEVAFTDVERAVRMVRANAGRWNIDKDAVGVAGQSAGALLTLKLASEFSNGNPDCKDRVERESSRPDFVAPLTSWYYGKDECPYQYGKDTPPFFMRHAVNDSGYEFARSIRKKLIGAGVPLDWKTVDEGGHGAFEITVVDYGHNWPSELIEWMKINDFLK